MSEHDDEHLTPTVGRYPITIPFAKTEPRPWHGWHLAAVMAVLLVTVGVIGLGMKLLGSNADGEPSDRHGQSTGFYVPGTLPDGWTVTSLDMFSTSGAMSGLECPCQVLEVKQAGAYGGYLGVISANNPARSSGEDLDRDKLEDRSGWYEEDGGIGTVVWRTAIGYRTISSSSLTRKELEAVADTWTTTDVLPELDGHSFTTGWMRLEPIETEHRLQWTFTNAESGQNVHVSMRPGSLGSGRLTRDAVTLPGNERLAGILPDDAGVVASWPGNTELLAMSPTDMTDSDGQATPPVGQATIAVILGSFQRADAVTWADYLASAPLDKTEPQDLDVLRTESIEDWWVGPEPDPDLPPPVVYPAPVDLPQPGMEITRPDPSDPAAAITVESDVDYVAVAASKPFTIDLTMTNRTGTTLEVSGCSFGSVTWSTIDANGLLRPIGARDVFCDQGLQPWPDGEKRTQTFEFPGLAAASSTSSSRRPTPETGPVAAFIQYGDTAHRGITVFVPGQVDL